MKFSKLSGDVNWLQYGAKWHSPKLNNGEFDYWLVLEFTNMHDATGEETGNKYHVSLSAVSPEQAGKDNLAKAFGCVGMPDECKANPLAQVEALDSYGVKAHVWQSSSNNAHKLLKEARREAQCVSGLFGFYMDRPENRIGSTGWEAVKGDMDSALARTIASGTTEGRILAKMHGVSLETLNTHTP